MRSASGARAWLRWQVAVTSLACLVTGLALSGCGAQPPATPEITGFVGPLAIPYPDSVDVAWTDTLNTSPAPPVRGAKPKKKKPATPAGTTAPQAAAGAPTGTSEATGLENSTPSAPAVAAETPPADSVPAAPVLTVRVTPDEVVKLTERWQADVGRAEKALEQLKGWSLMGDSAGQVTAAGKFLADSRTARGAKDYYRACELAEKARVLAEAVKITLGIK